MLKRRRLRGAWFVLLAMMLTGCFQAAGNSIEPTPVSLTSIAPRQNDTPTAFVTPLSTGGFVVPTDDPNSFLTPTPTGNIVVFPTPTPAQPTPTANIEPTQPLPPSPAPQIQVQPGGDQPTAPQPTTAGPVVAASPTLPPSPTAFPTEGPCVHTVQPGEWFYSIARKYNITPQDLLAANPRRNPDSLQPGDVLNIPNCNKQPAPPPAPTNSTSTPQGLIPAAATSGVATIAPTPIQLSGREYTVSEGDTLGAIARKFGTTVQALREANNLGGNDFLRVGQVLKIPKP